MVPEPPFAKGSYQKTKAYQSITTSTNKEKDQPTTQNGNEQKGLHDRKHSEVSFQDRLLVDEPRTLVKNGNSVDEDSEEQETTVWICCDVYDTGIGIPGTFMLQVFNLAHP